MQTPAVKDRLMQFFKTNQEEELSVEDMMCKFDCTRRSAQEAISTLAKTGAVETETIVRLRQ